MTHISSYHSFLLPAKHAKYAKKGFPTFLLLAYFAYLVGDKKMCQELRY